MRLVDRAELAEAVITLPSASAREGATGFGATGAERYEPLIESLTTREHDVLAFVADGLSNREVAHELAISEHTVKFHLASILEAGRVDPNRSGSERGSTWRYRNLIDLS